MSKERWNEGGAANGDDYVEGGRQPREKRVPFGGHKASEYVDERTVVRRYANLINGKWTAT